MYAIIVNLLLILALIIVSEGVAYTKLVRPDILRKLMHIATGAVVVVGSYLTDYRAYVPVGALMIIALVAARYILPLRSLQDRFHESHGEIYFAAGTMIAAFICPTLPGFVACVASLALADTAAYIAGKSLKSLVIYKEKTLAGSIACFVVASIIFICLGFSWGESLIIGLFIAGAELLGSRGLDNLSIPVVSALVLLYLN